MTRRSDKPLRIVCSDRGQHHEALLAKYWLDENGRHRLISALHSKSPTAIPPNALNDQVVYAHSPSADTISTGSYELRCRRCGRKPKRAAQVFLDELATAYQSQLIPKLDISLRDF